MVGVVGVVEHFLTKRRTKQDEKHTWNGWNLLHHSHHSHQNGRFALASTPAQRVLPTHLQHGYETARVSGCVCLRNIGNATAGGHHD